ncbi:MAG: type II toxin-antitoxin system HicB family antitoxin [Patescibacteria group bacterium]|nr:type II toxin-antitoxin system HicB family antitoxin [Patescibacteria group bacterium]
MKGLEKIPKKFAVQVHLGDDGIWWTDSPDIPGCYSQGKTQEEAILNMKDSIFTYFGVPARLSDPSLLKVEGELHLELATN